MRFYGNNPPLNSYGGEDDNLSSAAKNLAAGKHDATIEVLPVRPRILTTTMTMTTRLVAAMMMMTRRMIANAAMMINT